ncbi:D-glucuronyl C5-epimerase family protein [Myroides odoratimimus]|uniref:D-glucuronyl C5-epimerase family protein n=2 Tax=Myroides odoratimimus TaxID=76832 RepID=UPI002574DDE8|nr:D-glucuronyl C5-epimerase family protein [Myroides odoratimimus]
MKNFYFILLITLLFYSCKRDVTVSTYISTENNVFNVEDTVKVGFNAVDFLDKKVFNNDSLYPKFPFSGSNIAMYDNLERSEAGIPLIYYNSGHHYYPITFCQVALAYHANFLETKSENSKEEFLKISSHILNEAVLIEDFAVLQTELQVENYRLPSKWASAMSQGYAVVIMLQAYNLTRDNRYLDMSNKFLKSFDYSIDKGGVLNFWDGYPFYEEYADPKSHVLNGYMFSLAGLYYSYRVTGNNDAKRLFDQGINTLKAKIHVYDSFFTSNYNKLRVEEMKNETYASAINEDPDHYHELEIYQLLTLYYWTNESILREYAHKFIKYDTGKIDSYYDFDKFKKVTSLKLQENIDVLTDELGSWGNFWSTKNKDNELIIEFDKYRRNIEGIVFYSPTEESLPHNYSIYVWERDNWEKIYTNKDIYNKNRKYYKTGGFDTFIDINYFPVSFATNKLKISFDVGSRGNVSLREINVLFDQDDKVEYILNSIRKNVID